MFIKVIALAVVLGASSSQSAQAQTFTLLHTFSGAPDGAGSVAGLVQDAAGNLYGTTQQGGITAGVCTNTSLAFNGCGTVFKIDTSGDETVLYRFTGGTDGAFPSAGLVRDGAGNLYGTTTAGGASNSGTVFNFDTTGTLTTLHDVGSTGGLVIDAKGILYGSTSEGIFMLDPATKIFTVLDPTAGSGATMALDAAGNLYGTTEFGGTGGACGNGCGTVFKLDTTLAYQVLYSFTGAGNDGLKPLGGVTLDAAGNLWGTTSEGGAENCGVGSKKGPCGTWFEVSPAGGELRSFSLSGPLDPTGGLVLNAAGSFYGTSKFENNDGGWGTVFEIGGSGIQKLPHTFMGLPDGQYPVADLVLDSSGNLYGTTSAGGPLGLGTVFKIDPAGPQNFPLTVVIFGNGTVTGSGVDCSTHVCATWVSSGTMFTLTATPPAGSTFVGWVAPPCSGTGTCSVTVTSAQTVGATFDSDFTVSATALMPAAVSAGGSATSTINVAADAKGFFSSVALTCSVTPTPALAPTCSISPSSVAPGTPATLTVNTTAASARVMSSVGLGVFFALCLPLIAMVVTQVGLGSDHKSRKVKLIPAVLMSMLFGSLVFQIACGSSSTTTTGSKGTPPGSYMITVTGTYSTGSLVHTTPNLNLTVQ